MNGRRRATMLLAASLGLNVALGGILIYQTVRSGSEEYNRNQGRGDRRSGPPWTGDRSRSSVPDSIRALTHMSDEQTRQIRELRNAMETEIQPIRDEVQELQGSLRDELELAEPDLARVDSIMAEIWMRQRTLQRRSIDLMLEEREVLTPQQFRFFLRWMVPGMVTPGDAYDRDDWRREGGRQGQQRREDPGRPSGSTSPPPPGALPPPPG